MLSCEDLAQTGGCTPKNEVIGWGQIVTHNPVRIIEIRNGISADGGGIEIHVRMDGVDPMKVLEITLN